MVLLIYFLFLQNNLPNNVGNNLNLPVDVQIQPTSFSKTATPSPTSNSLLITIHNKNASPEITDIVLALEKKPSYSYSSANSKEPSCKFDQAISIGQVVSTKCEIPLEKSENLENLEVIVSYKLQGKDNSIGYVLPATHKKENEKIEKSSSIDDWIFKLLPVWSALIASISAFFTAYATHRFTDDRDSKKINFDWKKMLFDKYEKGYRKFLVEWSNSTDHKFLEEKFTQMSENSYISEKLKQLYNKTLETLRKPNTSEEDKQKACKELHDFIDKLLLEP